MLQDALEANSEEVTSVQVYFLFQKLKLPYLQNHGNQGKTQCIFLYFCISLLAYFLFARAET